MKRCERIWITWETQRRSLELAKHFSCKLFLFDYSGIFRYPLAVFNTVKALIWHRSTVLFVQNPSMILATLACVLGKLTSKIVVVDRHSTFRLKKPHRGSFKIWLFMRMHYFTLRHAHITVVTNEFLSDKVKKAGGYSIVLPDKIPNINPRIHLKLEGDTSIFMVSSFGNDEPLEEVFEAARLLQNRGDFKFYISGNYKKLSSHFIANKPQSIQFTGFLSETDFIDYLYASDIGMALTTSEACMLCGCYEIIAAGKPLITSNQSVLQNYFKNAFFTENSGKNIADAIIQVNSRLNDFRLASKIMKQELSQSWNENAAKLDLTIQSKVF